MKTPPPPRTRVVSGIRLAAVLTAVGLSRSFIRHTLTNWQLGEQIDVAELVVSELVTNAVKSTGNTDQQRQREDISAHQLIGVQLRMMNTCLYVEVWDSADGSPVIPEQSPDSEGGRGLFLVESLCTRWDISRPAAGGKIVWAELPLTAPVACNELEPVDIALMQQVLDATCLAHRDRIETVAV
ncbi:ATP-binding protein [Streptomyces polygonati]|uniref:ATP-binding protein n=1 Tax=Streptomyces polygonati TaxID=1617087 RepID=A0ABV8HPV4_9ACTN